MTRREMTEERAALFKRIQDARKAYRAGQAELRRTPIYGRFDQDVLGPYRRALVFLYRHQQKKRE